MTIKFSFVKNFSYLTIKYRRENKMQIKLKKEIRKILQIRVFLYNLLKENCNKINLGSWKYEERYIKINQVVLFRRNSDRFHNIQFIVVPSIQIIWSVIIKNWEIQVYQNVKIYLLNCSFSVKMNSGFIQLRQYRCAPNRTLKLSLMSL